MPTLQEILNPRPSLERRAVGRTTINRGVLMYFSGQDGVHACCVRDVTQITGRTSSEWFEYLAFRVWHFVRQLPHDAPLSTDLA
jgi:hypothetical protein